MTSVQRDIPFDAKMCTGCYKMCRFVCPTAIATKNESITPYGRSSAYHLAFIKRITYSPKAVESIYQCAACGLCKAWCKPEVDVAAIIEVARKEISQKKLAPETVTQIDEITKRNFNPYGEPSDKRFSRIKIETAKKSRKSEVLYFVGCTTAYRHPEIADAIISVMKKIGITPRIMSDSEQCCGSPMLRLGLEDTARKIMTHNVDAINNSGCSTIVTGCPGCYRTLKEDYAKQGFKLDSKVMHFTEFASSFSNSLPRVELMRKVTYHDPCHLGRRSNIYDQPRNILQQVKGLKLIEMDWNRKNANCCGSGGGLRLTYPKIAETVGLRRLKEIYATGAELITTACPFCKDQLVDVQNPGAQQGVRLPVLDVSEILAGTRTQ